MISEGRRDSGRKMAAEGLKTLPTEEIAP